MDSSIQSKHDLSIEQIRNKVPEVTIFFWIIKVLCTTVGETASDFLNVSLNFGLTGTSIVMGIVLATVLFFQFRSKKYIPGVYWVTVVLISIFGTLVTDNLTDSIGIPLEWSTLLFSVLLALTFVVWYTQEKTLSVHSIFTRRREVFYWLTVLFTFALGTATGDLMAESLGLGYFATGTVVVGVILIFAVAWRMGLDAVLAFWIIYVMTRPLGASLGDLLSQPQKYGGFGLGATGTSMVFMSAILVTVVYLSFTKKDMITKETMKKEIKEEEIEMEEGKKHTGALWQVGITIGLLLLVSGAGYTWRHKVLQEGTKSTIVPTSGSSAAAIPGVSTNKTSEAAVYPLGDVSNFKKIAQDMLDMVNGGDLSGAKKRGDDLEFEWDNAKAKLERMNPAKWTEVDGAIDKVLRQVRAVNKDAVGCKSSLEVLLHTLN